MSDTAGPTGVIAIDKPAGCTSHDVVDRVRRLYATRKVGHAGTLDPMATGVLVIGLGRATRLLSFLQPLPKRYSATVMFGKTTTTQDSEGEVTQERPCAFTREDLEAAAQRLTGEIEQMPPMVSAVKVAGERLYKAARRGEVVERKARRVFVYELDVTSFEADRWTATFEAQVSSGTYIRTLAADIGEVLGCGAHLSELRRTAIGSFVESALVTLDELEGMDSARRTERLMTTTEAMRDFPAIVVSGDDRRAVLHGQPLQEVGAVARSGELPVVVSGAPGARPAHEPGMSAGIPIAVVDENGELLAVYRKSAGRLKAAAVLA